MCARGDGIRGSKDLRAEIGKFPNSTNERKKMSNKTIKQRIAVVAASALTAGFLSVASMPAANASTGVFITAGITGTGVIVAPTGTGTGQTMTISAAGSVTITTVAGTGSEAKLTVSGGKITGSVLDVALTPTGPDAGLASSTSFIYGDEVNYITFTPDAGSSSMTITSYVSSDAATAGTKAAELIVLIKSATAVGVVDAGNSFVSVVDAGTTDAPTSDVDVAAAVSVANPTNGRINFDLHDGNNVDMSGSTVITATATGGCLVGLTNAATSYLSASASGAYVTYNEIFVSRSVANAPFSCTVTLTANGVEFGKKSIKLLGKVVKVEGADLVLAKKNATTSSAFNFSAYDAAGNAVNGVTVSTVDTTTDAFASSSAGTTDTSSAGPAEGSIVCNDTEGSGSFKLRVTNATNDVIDSPVYTVDCRGTAVNYSASLDKASYVPGDIATLTITAKSSKGNAVNDVTYLGGAAADGTGTANAPAIAGSNMTAVTAPTSTDKFSKGVKTYKFIVGATAGSYQLSVDLPKFNSSTYAQAAQTVPYKIASSGGVTNEEVLKSIVSLIASINKQIQALQKLILRR